MDSFKFLYSQACSYFKTSPCEKLLLRIEQAGNSSTLNLARLNFSNSTCKAFGQALAKDVHIKELDCSDCKCSDEGLISTLSGIERNHFLVTLNLKGNSIRSSGTEVLGKLIRHNNHLQSLNLEWNGLGIFPEKFAFFCECLSLNSSLKILNLQNNQLDNMCAQSLSDMLLRNSSLQNLDIRWNNIGLAGGRAILKSLKKNSTLLSLDSNGNDIPVDIQETMSLVTIATQKKFILQSEQMDKTKYLATKLHMKEEERKSQVKMLMDQLEKKDSDVLTIERLSAEKLSEVQENLAVKDKDYQNLTNKIQKLEIELQTLTLEKDQINVSLNAVLRKNKELKEEYDVASENKAKNKEETEKNFLQQLGQLKEEKSSLKQELLNLRRELTCAGKDFSNLQERYEKLENNCRYEIHFLKDKLKLLNQKCSQELEEKKLLHGKELSRMKAEYTNEKKSLEHKQLLLESEKELLEQEIKAKSSQIFDERSQNEEKLHQLENKLKSDHEKVRQKLEERIEVLEEANKEQHDHLQANLQLIYQQKTDLTTLDLNLAEQDHEIDHLQKLLEEKTAEMKACEAKVRLEVKEQMEELKDCKDTIQRQIQEYSMLHNSMKEMEVQFKKELELKTTVIHDLEIKIQLQHERNLEIIEDEKRRTQELQKAFQIYLKSSVQRNEKF